MTVRGAVAGFAWLLLAGGGLRGQSTSMPSVSRAQQAACHAHHVERWCGLLSLDFARKRMVVTPLGDLKALGADMAPRALRMALEAQANSALKTSAEQAGERALQTISVAGAVNQASGAASTSGSTDLATKPTTTDFLSIAEATGGFTETQNGSSVTLQANALGMTKYLRDEPVFARLNGRAADWLQPLTVTVNLAQSGATSVPTVGTSGAGTTGGSGSASIGSLLLPATSAALDSVGVNYEIYRRYSPQDPKFAAAWRAALVANQTALAAAGGSLARAVNALMSATLQGNGLETMNRAESQWQAAGAAAEQAGDFDGFAAAFEQYRDGVTALLLQDAAAAEAVNRINLALEAEQEATETVLEQARGKPLATMGYLYSTPSALPATHSLTVTLAEVFRSGMQLTGDFAAEIYANVPTGASYGRLRDVQLAAELDRSLGRTASNPRATMTVAGYGQYQYDPTVLNVSTANVAPGTTIPVSGQVLAGTAGWLGVVQGKLALRLRPGLTLPLAIKWSNRTELLNASDVRGQFGLSFDLSALGRLVTGAQ